MLEMLTYRLAELLYQLSTALLLPIMLLVSALLVIMLMTLGGLLREWTERRQTRATLSRAVTLLAAPSAPEEVWRALRTAAHGLPARLTAGRPEPPETPLAAQAWLAELESDVTNRLARVGFVTRVGPMLGLLGTLIPFGPALSGLSSGNLQQLSANLITAFATTVVGLLCGCLGYGIAQVRRSWYSRDFDVLEVVVNEIVARTSHEETEAAKMGFRG